MSKEMESHGVLVQIKRIKQLSFVINEAARTFPNTLSTVLLDFKSGFNLERKFIDFTIRVTYLDPETKKVLIQSEIQTIFEIENINEFIKDNMPNLPSSSLIGMTGMSISHSRAILTTSLAGTVYNDFILPIMDTKKVAKQFFGDKINLEELKEDKIGLTASNANEFK